MPKTITPFVPIVQHEKENIRQSPSSTKGQKGKGYTAEEASLPDNEANEGQWPESVDTSQYDTWQAYGSIWDWTAEADWDEAEAHFKTGKVPRSGHHNPVGLPRFFHAVTQHKIS
jgi:hypothetical protein